jgi:hypothetical protein
MFEKRATPARLAIFGLAVWLAGGVGAAEQAGRRPSAFNHAPFPKVTAYTEEGTAVELPEFFKGKYTVLTTGCLTCPIFCETYAETETVAKDYASDKVQFFYLYKALAHPENKGYVEPLSTDERLKHIARAKEELGTKITWLCDPISNEVLKALDAGPNSVYLMDPSGMVIYSSQWSDATALREQLAKRTGKTQTPTPVRELNLPRQGRSAPPPQTATATRVVRPAGLVTLKLEPADPEAVHYVKLRAEAEPQLLTTGSGRLYLGFFPDPILGAHWNNLAAPMQYELTLPDGVTATPQKATAATGAGNSDSEPREFWVEFEGNQPPEPVQLTLRYFACTDALCLSLTQTTTIVFEKKDAGGWTFGFSPNQSGQTHRRNAR